MTTTPTPTPSTAITAPEAPASPEPDPAVVVTPDAGIPPDTDTPEAEATDPAVGKARKEAASYRERLRSTEGERDTANATIDTLRHQIIDGQVESLGIKPAAFWASGANLADLLTVDGGVDSDLVTEVATAARAMLGLAERRTPMADTSIGARSTSTASHDWSTLLNK